MKARKIFVTYGNESYYHSLERIRHEAEATGEFDEILIFTDHDLPEEVKQSELMKYKRGGGYWLWKPWVVLQALETASDNDIIVYSDCGNTLYKHSGWKKLFKKMDNAAGLFFYNGSKMAQYTKRSVLNYFDSKLLKNNYQIMSGFFIISKPAKHLISRWYNLMLTHPDLVLDVKEEDRECEYKEFIMHRHDQAILSGVIYSTSKKEKLLVLPEQSERLRASGQPIYNSRISDNEQRSKFYITPTFTFLILDYIIKPYRKFVSRIIRYLNKN